MRNPKNNKSYGNTFERDTAKKLSLWLYNDPDVLKRTASSGADKSISASDIMIMKQTGNKLFDLHIECKNGYSKKESFLNACEQIEQWHKEALLKGITSPIWIIWKIPRKGVILASTESLGILSVGTIGKLYIYEFENIFKLLTKEKFFKIFKVKKITKGE